MKFHKGFQNIYATLPLSPAAQCKRGYCNQENSASHCKGQLWNRSLYQLVGYLDQGHRMYCTYRPRKWWYTRCPIEISSNSLPNRLFSVCFLWRFTFSQSKLWFCNVNYWLVLSWRYSSPYGGEILSCTLKEISKKKITSDPITA